MRILVQWASDPPGGWQEIDSRDWVNLPKKPQPSASRIPVYDGEQVMDFTGDNEIIDSRPGWINCICIQGMPFSYDHIAVLQHDDHVEIIGWNDDPDDWDADEFIAYCWKYYPAEDHRTIQYLTVYAGAKIAQSIGPLITGGKKVPILSWLKFIPPDAQHVRHGIWMTDDLHNKHRRLSKSPTWHEWIGDPA